MMYWNNEGTYETEAKALNDLVPGSGMCETLKGEIWRAVSKIYYECFNNGFCNNFLNPAAFLMNKVEMPREVKEILHEHARGNMITLKPEVYKSMDLMVDTVIVALRGMADSPNKTDMWEYEPAWHVKNKFAEEYGDYDEYEFDEQGYF